MGERVITTVIQITKVYRDVSEDFDVNKSEYGNKMKSRIKEREHADDVVVLDVHEVQLQGLRDQMDDEFIGRSESDAD